MRMAKTASASFWMSLLNDLRAPGLEYDILNACTDYQQGFTDALKGFFPQVSGRSAPIIRSATAANTPYKWIGSPFTPISKKHMQNTTLNAAEHTQEAINGNWGQQYRHAMQSWRNNSPGLPAILIFPLKSGRSMFDIVNAMHLICDCNE